MTIVFATCDHQPLIAEDDVPLAEALRARRVDVVPIPWTEIDPLAVIDAPPVLLRSTWDYHRVPTLFASWLDAMTDSGRPMWNPANVARSNIDKIYLRSLAASGIAVPKTRWLDRVDDSSIAEVLQEEGWDRAVLKPRIGATAHGMFVVTPGIGLSDADLMPARASGALVQAFVPEIESRGEISLVYAGGAFSHAVSKHAQPGEFRVQKDFGGSVVPLQPGADLLAFAARVMRDVPDTWLYARVDVVETNLGPLLIELELIEPELYLTIVDASSHGLADTIVDKLALV